MKTLTFTPINEVQQVNTGSDLLQALLSRDLKVLTACGGKGLCATCHVHITHGMDELTPRTSREARTLGFIRKSAPNSRLACQSQVLGEGVVVELPVGMDIERAEDLTVMVGMLAPKDILHPVNGSILIALGKMITRSRIEQLSELNAEVAAVHQQA